MKNKLELIETPDYVLAVSEEDIKENDLIYYLEKSRIMIASYTLASCINSLEQDLRENKKIIAYQPKGHAAELDLPLLPEMVVEDEVENELNKEFYIFEGLFNITKTVFSVIWRSGYRAATKVYSEEDLIAFSIWRGTTNTKDFHNCKNPREQFQLWKTLKQPKTPAHFLLERIEDNKGIGKYLFE